MKKYLVRSLALLMALLLAVPPVGVLAEEPEPVSTEISVEETAGEPPAAAEPAPEEPAAEEPEAESGTESLPEEAVTEETVTEEPADSVMEVEPEPEPEIEAEPEGETQPEAEESSVSLMGEADVELLATTASGTCGANLTWTLDSTGTLTISGTGAMTDFGSYSSVPWYSYRNDIKSVVVENGVTTIGGFAFSSCFSLASVAVPDSLVSIGKNAFHACTILEEITLSEHTTDIHETAFSDCTFLVMHAPEGSTAAQYAIDHELVPENVVMGSAHPYQKSGIWEYTHYEEAAALLVTFSSKTDVTGFHDMDSLYVTDANGREMQYKGTKLAGETLMLAGNTFTVYLKEVWSTKNEFGFRIISVTGLSQEEYEARLAVADPAL